ncbi:dephospho-CoA kinase [Desulfocurvibacter africanus]|uniref:dephospho-CoA kinase n=1 Tax=Desulfocurvibacter africanus TaxID=873 RepID=UPI002FDA060C
MGEGEGLTKLYEGVAGPNAAGKRLDVFLGEQVGDGFSRGRVQEWIKIGLASVDGKPWTKPSLRLRGGENVCLLGRAEGNCLTPEQGDLAVLYRDDWLLVLNKPAGLTTHPAPSCPEGTLVHRLLHHFPELAALDSERPGIVHRLDKDTSGLLVVALTERARLALAEDFAERRVDKVYLALVHGRPQDRGDIDLPMGRHPTHKTRMAVLKKGGRPARSAYEMLWSSRDGRFSLLRVRIFTGRTHQIRVHLAAIGHPIIGDSVYGPGPFAGWDKDLPWARLLAKRQMLHAHRLRLAHPADGRELVFVSTPPKDFRRLPLLLDRRVQRVGLTGMPGSGKSTLLRLLAEKNVPTFSADKAVAELYAPGGDGTALLARRFGERFMTEASGVNKRALFQAMLENSALRREVEELVHPLVKHRMELFFQAHQHERLAVAEIPLLVEAGWEQGKEFDMVVGIAAPAYKRKEWLHTERGLSEQAAAALESWQWPEERKLSRCDLIVRNPGDLPGLRAEAGILLADLRQRRARQVRELMERLDRLWRASASAQGREEGTSSRDSFT